MFWVAGAAALVAVLLLVFLGSPLDERGGTAGIVVRDHPAARWSHETHGARERIVLEQGTLSIEVTDDSSALLVVLPDGELEDTGTIFSVSVEEKRTRRVVVEQGSVILRLRGQTAVTLRAGDSWSAPSTQTPPSPTATTSTTANPPRVEIAPRADSAASAPRVAELRGPASAHREPVSEPNPASEDFRAALDALKSGRHREAALKFAYFGKAYPQDSRAEDAAYLRVLALERNGDAAALNAAAADYLRRYPAGFRRAEVEKLAR